MPAEKPTITSVTTFVADLPGVPLDQALAKFQGRRTVKTLVAARRMSAAKQRIKIPRNLLRQLWRGTGGFNEALFKASNEAPPAGNANLLAVEIGDLRVVFNPETSYGPTCWLAFRGQWAAKATPEYNKQVWLDKERALAFARSLGVKWTPPEKK